jgi:hypothetical protein
MTLFNTSKKTTERFQPGDKIVVVGATLLDREVFIYQDPVSFVAEIAKTDVRITGTNSNQEFMHKVAMVLQEVDVTIPHHNEEVFMAALARAGILSKASLN